MKAMILAAGRGQRMGSLTMHKPKPLTILNGRTLIEYNLLRIIKADIKEVIINLSWLGDQIRDYLGDGKKWDINIRYIDEGSKMLGTGGGVLNALSILGDDPFWLVNSDIYTNYEIDRNIKLNDKYFGHLVLVNNPDHHLQGDFSLVNDKVSPISNLNKNSLTFSGISLLTSKIFQGIRKEVFQLGPLLEKRASEGLISGESFAGHWFDVGSKDRLNTLDSLILKKRV